MFFLICSNVLIFIQFKPEEITAINNDFNEPGSLAPTGLYIGGTKYMVIQGEPGAVIRGKKVTTVSDFCLNSDHGFADCVVLCVIVRVFWWAFA